MAKNNKRIPIDYFTEKLQEQYQQDLLVKVIEVLAKKGFPMETEEEFNHLFRERLKKSVHEGMTTMSIDGVAICAYGQLEVLNKKKYIVQGDEIETTFKFVQL